MRRDTHLEQQYVPVAVAADICGVSPRTVYTWIKQAKANRKPISKGERGRMRVHLGSVLSKQKRGDKGDQVQRWLRNHMMYKSLARQASTELGYAVSITTVHEAMQRVKAQEM